MTRNDEDGDLQGTVLDDEPDLVAVEALRAEKEAAWDEGHEQGYDSGYYADDDDEPETVEGRSQRANPYRPLDDPATQPVAEKDRLITELTADFEASKGREQILRDGFKAGVAKALKDAIDLVQAESVRESRNRKRKAIIGILEYIEHTLRYEADRADTTKEASHGTAKEQPNA